MKIKSVKFREENTLFKKKKNENLEWRKYVKYWILGGKNCKIGLKMS